MKKVGVYGGGTPMLGNAHIVTSPNYDPFWGVLMTRGPFHIGGGGGEYSGE